MPEKPLSAIPRAQREQYEKGKTAYDRNNLDYAISILGALLKMEPGFSHYCEEASVVTRKEADWRFSDF